jgi:hypothetical protein
MIISSDFCLKVLRGPQYYDPDTPSKVTVDNVEYMSEHWEVAYDNVTDVIGTRLKSAFVIEACIVAVSPVKRA